jgi:hypothetical protein
MTVMVPLAWESQTVDEIGFKHKLVIGEAKVLSYTLVPVTSS